MPSSPLTTLHPPALCMACTCSELCFPSSVPHSAHTHAFSVYDVANRESFDALPRWYSELETYVSDSVVKILVGNKVDKEYSRQVPTTEGQQFATRMNSLFIEASAKTSQNVKDIFQGLVEKIMDTPELWDKDANRPHNTAHGNGGVPGGVQLVGREESQEDGGCAC